MTDTQQLAQGFLILASAVQTMLQKSGTRLTRAELAERLGIHRNTLASRLETDPNMPRPGSDGKWLLSEIVEWELHRQTVRHP